MADTNEEAIRSNIRDIIGELAPDPSAGVADESDLVDDLAFHSLALLELAFALEDEYDLPPMDEASVQHIRTARDIQDYVLAQLRVSGAIPE